ncbi:MAG: response regulator transcription factor [Bacillota bacterium]
MNFNIYIVEDEKNLNQLLSSYLKNEGWEVRSFLTGKEAQKAIPESPDLWILDIMLPDIDGYQLISEIKEKDKEIPVIFISARDADLDKIIGLEKGSDDYLAKPFSPRELVIRTEKLLKRVYGSKNKENIDYGKYNIDLKSRQVLDQNEEEIDLTVKEFDLLVYLLKNKGQALSREQIIEEVWEENYYGSDRVVDDLIRRVRNKLPDLNIDTIYGHGYRLVDK